MPNIYARMFPTDTPIQVYGPTSPQPGGGGMVYPLSPGIAVMGSSTWGSSILGLSTQFVMGNGSFGTESDPLSLHLDQTTPQTFSGTGFTGNGLLKITSGTLGVDATTYISTLTTSTPTNLTGFIKGNGSVLSADNSTYLATGSALLLDQTTPQTVINGAPQFEKGISRYQMFTYFP